MTGSGTFTAASTLNGGVINLSSTGNLGSTLGATALGAVLNYGLTHANSGKSVTSDQLRQLLEAPAGTMTTDTAIGLVLQQSLNLTFWAMLLISLTIVFLALMVPPVEIRRAVEVPAE